MARIRLCHSCMQKFWSWLVYAETYAYRGDNFVVGLTNDSPLLSTPTLWQYTLCGQYPGAVPGGATVSLYCPYNLPPFRYVVVQFPMTDHMTICELEVIAPGIRDCQSNILAYSISFPGRKLATLMFLFNVKKLGWLSSGDCSRCSDSDPAWSVLLAVQSVTMWDVDWLLHSPVQHRC